MVFFFSLPFSWGMDVSTSFSCSYEGGKKTPALSNSIRYNREGYCDLPILAVLTPINFMQKQNFKIKYSFPGGGGWGWERRFFFLFSIPRARLQVHFETVSYAGGAMRHGTPSSQNSVSIYRKISQRQAIWQTDLFLKEKKNLG